MPGRHLFGPSSHDICLDQIRTSFYYRQDFALTSTCWPLNKPISKYEPLPIFVFMAPASFSMSSSRVIMDLKMQTFRVSYRGRKWPPLFQLASLLLIVSAQSWVVVYFPTLKLLKLRTFKEWRILEEWIILEEWRILEEFVPVEQKPGNSGKPCGFLG